MRDSEPRSSGVSYTNVDQNATGTTTLYDPNSDAYFYAGKLDNVGSSAVLVLEVTDGTNTANMTAGQTAGNDIDYGDTVELDGASLVQVNVTTVNSDAGVDGNETAVAFHSET